MVARGIIELMAKAPIPELPQHTRSRVLLLVFFLLLLYVALPRMGNFSASFAAMREARLDLIALGLILVIATYVCATGVYQNLALKPLYFKRTLLVQTANAFVNRLLPAGIGGMTLSVQYLRKSGYTLPQAVAVAGCNNMLGVVGHTLLLVLVVLVSKGTLLDQLELPRISSGLLIVGGLLGVLTAILFILQRVRRYLYALTSGVLTYVATYRNHLSRLFGALFCSLGLTGGYVLTFYLCVLAVGMDVSLWNVFVVFTVGMVATAVTPTPGGLGGTEAGLLAGLVAYGADPPMALASVLLYRFLTYWLPLLPGFIVFLVIRKRYI